MLIGPDTQNQCNYTEGPSLLGGYVTVGGQQVPGPLLQKRADYVNLSLERMADTIQADGEAHSTAIILTAKHGQSPLNQHPAAADRRRSHHCRRQHRLGRTASGATGTLVVQEADDDGLLWWLSDRSRGSD